MWRTLGLRTKLLFLCGTLLFFTVVVGAVSFWGINKMDESLSKLSTVSIPNIKSADNMYLYYSKIRIALRTLGLPGISKAEEDASVQTVVELIGMYEKENKHYRETPFSPGEKEIYAQVEKDWTDFKSIGTRVLALHKSGTAEDKAKILAIFLKDCPEAAAAYNKSILALVSFHEANANKWIAKGMEEASFIKYLQNSIMIGGILCGFIVGYFFARSISRLLHEISDSLNEGSDKIASFTNEINTASTSLSASITQQAAALQQTTAAVEETSASVVSNADNAKKSAEVSEHSKESVHVGKVAVENVMKAIDDISASIVEIKNEIENSNKEISGIVTIINEIGVKTKVINEIVFQTKLLSFNASVEAARAGEHGKGFAVVAEEVGNLAAMSGNSAKEITDLLENSIRQVEATVEHSKSRISALMEASKDRVITGTETAQKCSEALDEIISHVNNVNIMVNEISSASNEQSQSIREITKAMSEIDSASHQNSSASQSARESANHLGDQVEDFRGLVIRLNTFIEGKKSA